DRLAHVAPADAPADAPAAPEGTIAHLARHLEEYQSPRLARRFRALVEMAGDPVLAAAVARGYHKLLSYKDEYEVARLLSGARAKVAEEFAGNPRLTYHLAPPLLARTGHDGRPQKRAFGPWIERAFPVLARLRVLRGTPLDPFGYTSERRMERALIRQYERDMRDLLPRADGLDRDALVALAELPLQIRGFGPVKAANAEKAAARRAELLSALAAGGGAGGAAVRTAAE
ncbi:MAG: DUF6537 domain-containing protein, partial [Tranquillimonas sp.]